MLASGRETDDIERVRSFNRGWVKVLGLLDQGLLRTEYSLTEARAIFELAQQDSCERQAVRDRLGIDASFLTRVLTKLEQRGLVASSPSATDARAINLALTPAGRAAFEDLNQRSRDQIQELLTPLTVDQRREVVEAMTVI